MVVLVWDRVGFAAVEYKLRFLDRHRNVNAIKKLYKHYQIENWPLSDIFHCLGLVWDRVYSLGVKSGIGCTFFGFSLG